MGPQASWVSIFLTSRQMTKKRKMKKVRAKLNLSEVNSSDEEVETSKVPSQKPKCTQRKVLHDEIEKFDKIKKKIESITNDAPPLDVKKLAKQNEDLKTELKADDAPPLDVKKLAK